MKRFFKISIWAVLLILSVALAVNTIMRLPMNSDSAGMLLYADDILSGNIFLSGWHLTGLTFITTDLPFFIIGVAIAGVGLNAFRIAVSLMYCFMLASAVPLVLYKVKSKSIALGYLSAIGLFPSVYALSNAFVHTGVFALMFLAIFFLLVYENTEKNRYLGFFAAATALAVAGDHMALVLITVPVGIICLFKSIKKPVKVFCYNIAGSALGIALEAAYLFIGNAELNNLSRTSFSEILQIPVNLQTYIEYFLRLCNAYFFGKDIFSIKTLAFALKIVLIIFAMYIAAKCIKGIFTRCKTDLPSAILGIGFLIVSALLIITDMSIDITAGRYIAYLPLMVSILLARADINYSLSSKFWIYAVCFMLAFAGIIPRGSEFTPYNAYSGLAGYLQSQNLTHGYATFWDSSVINAYSGNKVKVEPVRNTKDGIAPRLWFSKLEAYKNKATFFILRRGGSEDEEELYNYNGIYNIFLGTGKTHGKTYEIPLDYDAVISSFGEPAEILQFKNYDIFIYDDISQKLIY